MPLKPKFALHQDDELLYLKITIPYVRASSSEVVIDGKDVSFYCKPYLLRLKLPGDVENDEHPEFRAVYDPNIGNGTITLHLPKTIKGFHFEDLDLLNTLLFDASPPTATTTPSDRPAPMGGRAKLIEVISESTNEDVAETADVAIEDNDTATWKDSSDGLPELMDCLKLIDANNSSRHPYGFNFEYSGILGTLREEFFDLIEIPDPEGTSPELRRKLREERETEAFDDDRFMGDFAGALEDPIFLDALAFKAPWDEAYGQLSSTRNSEEVFAATGGFSEMDTADMASLRTRTYTHMDSTGIARMVLVTADILFAYCYDQRLTGGEGNVESAFNISRLSAALSWGDVFEEGEEQNVMRAAVRRSLCYPYLRVWKLSRKVLADVVKIMLLGKRFVVRALLDTRRVFESSEQGHYLLNKIYLNDLCAWAQGPDMEDVFKAAGRRFNSAKSSLEKGSIGFDLEVLEAAVTEALDGNETGGNVAEASNEEDKGKKTTSPQAQATNNGELLGEVGKDSVFTILPKK